MITLNHVKLGCLRDVVVLGCSFRNGQTPVNGFTVEDFAKVAKDTSGSANQGNRKQTEVMQKIIDAVSMANRISLILKGQSWEAVGLAIQQLNNLNNRSEEKLLCLQGETAAMAQALQLGICINPVNRSFYSLGRICSGPVMGVNTGISVVMRNIARSTPKGPDELSQKSGETYSCLAGALVKGFGGEGFLCMHRKGVEQTTGDILHSNEKVLYGGSADLGMFGGVAFCETQLNLIGKAQPAQR